MKQLFFFFVFGFVFNSCTQNNMTDSNHLSNQTSPYLLQHVNNPVDWYPWGEEALNKARKENKLILISIGYSACHWCHVMEKESFEDIEVAKIMNKHFVSIKVDREERPDVDHIYMNAVHLMKQRGGWPLNCIALPDGRPVWGGTYFRKQNWINQIQKVANLFTKSPDILESYAQKITDGIATTELVEKNTDNRKIEKNILDNYYKKWAKKFDNKNGGRIGSPKFPIPNNYQFLLDYGILSENTTTLNHVLLTLKKIASGGIYDHLGGGFCRYSTDEYWKVPHFEKMLYDNAQLVSLYTAAYTYFKDDNFKSIIYKTLEFIERELYDKKSGAFYSSLDADSEGEEGKFYVWEKEEIKNILNNQEDYKLCEDYYNINTRGSWDGKYILLKNLDDTIIAKKHNLTVGELNNKINNINTALFHAREKRVRPGLDDKSLTSWNGLMLKAYTDAYKTFNDKKILKTAIKNGEFLLKRQKQKNGRLFHSYKNGISNINGFLEDYAFVIEGFIGLYESTFNEKWLDAATQLMDYTLKHFFDEKTGMFFFTSNEDIPLITRKFEITDNVIPASNSSVAKSLLILSHIVNNKKYKDISEQMVNNVKNDINNYGPGYSNWANIILAKIYPFYQLVIVGKEAENIRNKLLENYLPNKIIVGTKRKSTLEILMHKFVQDKTMIYICQDGACQAPTQNIQNALQQIIY